MTVNNDRVLNILYKDDLEFYQTLIENYEILTSEDINMAYDLAKQMILAADRWNEISFELSKKYKELGIPKSDLQQWAYHRYRLLMTMHEFCRVIYRQGVETLKNRSGEFY